MIPKHTSCVLVGPSLEIPYQLYVQSLFYFIMLPQLPQPKPAPRHLGIRVRHTDSHDQVPQGNMLLENTGLSSLLLTTSEK